MADTRQFHTANDVMFKSFLINFHYSGRKNITVLFLNLLQCLFYRRKTHLLLDYFKIFLILCFVRLKNDSPRSGAFYGFLNQFRYTRFTHFLANMQICFHFLRSLDLGSRKLLTKEFYFHFIFSISPSGLI